jgi:hypothetical protein
MHDADQAKDLPVHRPIPIRVPVGANDDAGAGGPHEAVVGGLDLPGTKRHPSPSELDRADHPKARRGGQWRAGRDGYLEVVAHRVGQALNLGVGE